MKKIKLMMVSAYFPPHIGGVENYAYNISNSLSKKHLWDVIVVTSNSKNQNLIVEKKKGITLYRIPVLFKISNTPIHPLWYFMIKKIIKKEKPDIINAHAPLPFMSDVAAIASGTIPFILTYHAGTMKKNKFFFDLIISFYEKMVLPQMFKRAKKIICVSKFVARTMAKDYGDKTTIISPAVDITIFSPGSPKRIPPPTVLFVGRHANMYRMKGLYYVVEAIKQLPSVRLRVVGEKISLPVKNVSFVGIKTGKALTKEMQKAHVLVLASLANVESFGMALIEAMACRTPVIGTRTGGITEVITHKKDGILIPPENIHTLKNAIALFIDNPMLAKKMGQAGYEKVKNNYRWYIQAEKTKRVLENVLHT